MMNEVDLETNHNHNNGMHSHAAEEAYASPHHHAVSHELCGPRRRIIGGIVGLIVLVVIVIVSVVATRNNNNSASNLPPYATIPPEHEALYTQVEEALTKIGISTDDLLLREGHQYKALDWLSTNKHLKSYSRTQTLQRYALACLWYATNDVPHVYAPEPGTWIRTTSWLSDEPECDWAHVHCDLENKTQKLIFQKNNMSGKLPLELGLVREPLHMLDVTSNQIYMRGTDFEVFDLLHQLKHLEMEDNFLESESGLPHNLKALSNLEELKLSYNLIGGPLDNGVLESLQKLTHLEIESNFVTGALPFISEMTNLVYIYLRRNDLTSHLNFLKGDKLTNLFSLWLDGNTITRTIPTQVGQLTELASISVTNSSLTGNLPTELGILPKLNRIWFYGNNLNGTVPTELASLSKLEILEIQHNNIQGSMPRGICETIGKSSYEHKALIADCKEVSCDECCTKCV